MSLDRVTFPAKPANPVRKLYRSVARFSDDSPIITWLIVLAFATVVMTISAVCGRAS